MENISFSELKKQRKFHLEKIADLNQQIADYQSNRLAKKHQIKKMNSYISMPNMSKFLAAILI